MLVIGRKPMERIQIGHDVVVTVIEIAVTRCEWGLTPRRKFVSDVPN